MCRDTWLQPTSMQLKRVIMWPIKRKDKQCKLPVHLCQCESLGQVAQDSSVWFLRPWRSVTFLFEAPSINLLTYLLTTRESC